MKFKKCYYQFRVRLFMIMTVSTGKIIGGKFYR